MSTWKIVIELLEPFTCAARPVVGNEIQTVDFIPATVLRGALAQWLCMEGRAGELEQWFGPGGPRYSPAWPSPDNDRPAIPMPLSFYRDKDDEGFSGIYGVYNALWGPAPQREGEHSFQWKRIGPGPDWLIVDNHGTPCGAYRIAEETAMHVALHYARQSAREGALFSRAVIPPGTKFVAYVTGVSDELARSFPSIELAILLGKRRSAGNGCARVRFVPLESEVPPWQQRGNTGEGPVAVELMSDALIPSPTGGWLRGLDEQTWQRLLELRPTIMASFSAHRVVMGWSVSWGLPREPVLSIMAGSCFLLDADDHKALLKGLSRLVETGIGARREEGFGLIAVNPPWLLVGRGGKRFGAGGTGSGQRRTPPMGQPLPWPGAEAIPRDRLRGLAQKASDCAKEIEERVPGARQKMIVVMNYAKRANTPNQIAQYVERFAQRPNPRGWDSLKRLLEPVLGQCEDVAEARFLTEAIASLLPVVT